MAEWSPGLILLDIDLPGIDGHKLCAKLKSDGQYDSPAIIAITGLDDPAEKSAILSNGADAFFAKPLDMEGLIRAIQELLAKYQGESDERSQAADSHR